MILNTNFTPVFLPDLYLMSSPPHWTAFGSSHKCQTCSLLKYNTAVIYRARLNVPTSHETAWVSHNLKHLFFLPADCESNGSVSNFHCDSKPNLFDRIQLLREASTDEAKATDDGCEHLGKIGFFPPLQTDQRCRGTSWLVVEVVVNVLQGWIALAVV